jgi:hypothetical protein
MSTQRYRLGIATPVVHVSTAGSASLRETLGLRDLTESASVSTKKLQRRAMCGSAARLKRLTARIPLMGMMTK